MSTWTHVVSVFRIDHIRYFGELDFVNIFGKTCKFEDKNDIWVDAREHPDEYLPMGSEGSLEMNVWTNPDRGFLPAYTVSVFGDLRDYNDIYAIKAWFYKCCSKVNIRQAVIEIYCEESDPVVLNYRQEDS